MRIIIMIKKNNVLGLHSGSRGGINNTGMLLTYVGLVSIKEERGGASCAQRRRAKR